MTARQKYTNSSTILRKGKGGAVDTHPFGLTDIHTHRLEGSNYPRRIATKLMKEEDKTRSNEAETLPRLPKSPCVYAYVVVVVVVVGCSEKLNGKVSFPLGVQIDCRR